MEEQTEPRRAVAPPPRETLQGEVKEALRVARGLFANSRILIQRLEDIQRLADKV